MHASISDAKDLKLVVVTVATEQTDGYKRFMKSCRLNNLDVKVISIYLYYLFIETKVPDHAYFRGTAAHVQL